MEKKEEPLFTDSSLTATMKQYYQKFVPELHNKSLKHRSNLRDSNIKIKDIEEVAKQDIVGSAPVTERDEMREFLDTTTFEEEYEGNKSKPKIPRRKKRSTYFTRNKSSHRSCPFKQLQIALAQCTQITSNRRNEE